MFLLSNSLFLPIPKSMPGQSYSVSNYKYRDSSFSPTKLFFSWNIDGYKKELQVINRRVSCYFLINVRFTRMHNVIFIRFEIFPRYFHIFEKKYIKVGVTCSTIAEGMAVHEYRNFYDHMNQSKDFRSKIKIGPKNKLYYYNLYFYKYNYL